MKTFSVVGLSGLSVTTTLQSVEAGCAEDDGGGGERSSSRIGKFYFIAGSRTGLEFPSCLHFPIHYPTCTIIVRHPLDTTEGLTLFTTDNSSLTLVSFFRVDATAVVVVAFKVPQTLLTPTGTLSFLTGAVGCSVVFFSSTCLWARLVAIVALFLAAVLRLRLRSPSTV